MRRLIDILLYMWQLPQNALGLLLRLIYKGTDSEYESSIVRRSTKMRGGISLGRYIIVSQQSKETTIMHEYGHSRQSQRLGWLYLIVVGLPSLVWAGIHERTGKSYYWFYTEKWADRLGNVKR